MGMPVGLSMPVSLEIPGPIEGLNDLTTLTMPEELVRLETPDAMSRIFEIITAYSKEMGDLHGDFLKIARRDIGRFLEKTEDIQSQMQSQATAVFFIGVTGSALTIVGVFIPKGPDQTSSTIQERLKDNEFWKKICETGGQLCSGPLDNIAKTYYQSRIVQVEADCKLLEICFRESQQEKSVFDQENRRAQDAVLQILQSKARSG